MKDCNGFKNLTILGTKLSKKGGRKTNSTIFI